VNNQINEGIGMLYALAVRRGKTKKYAFVRGRRIRKHEAMTQ
jgi:hypothetical protein